MNVQLIDLFNYHQSLNKQLIHLLINHQDALPDEAFDLYSHCINAHQIWNARITGEPSFAPFDIHPVADYEKLESANFEKTHQLLATTNLSQVIHYQSSTGEKFQNTVGEIYFHLVNHYTHHKAQISTLLRQNGITPLKSDYIFYTRK
tara:strand:+ start:2507 stop:2950 length:444 start_codon:yes stop_codon:yes gene_type:complete